MFFFTFESMKYVMRKESGWISWDDYKKAFGLKSISVDNGNNTAACAKSMEEKAYEVAQETRKFEIELYWKRATYFWAFITTIYVAYYKILVNVYCKDFGHFPLVVLSGMGLFFAIAWILVAKGSRHWQENWETHVSLLEDEITGPLYKIYNPRSFSVTKVNLCAGYVVATCAGGLYIYEIGAFCQKIALEYPSVNPFVLFLVIFMLSVLGIVTFIFMSKGNVREESPIQLKMGAIK